MWSIKVSEFDISFEPMKAMKAQLFAYFIEEMISSASEPTHNLVMFTDDSSKRWGSGANLILENEDGW